jgi:hypothetical protein
MCYLGRAAPPYYLCTCCNMLHGCAEWLSWGKQVGVTNKQGLVTVFAKWTSRYRLPECAGADWVWQVPMLYGTYIPSSY